MNGTISRWFILPAFVIKTHKNIHVILLDTFNRESIARLIKPTACVIILTIIMTIIVLRNILWDINFYIGTKKNLWYTTGNITQLQSNTNSTEIWQLSRFFFVLTSRTTRPNELFDCPELALTVYNRQRDSKAVNRSPQRSRKAC